MDDQHPQDRVERDAADIASAAADAQRQREKELAADADKSTLDAQIAELSRRRDQDVAHANAARDAILADAKRIDDDTRDMRDALGASGQPNPGGGGGNPGQGGGGNPGSGGGSVPGPSNPPIVPPRRVG